MTIPGCAFNALGSAELLEKRKPKMKLPCWTVRAVAIALFCQSALAQEPQAVPKPLYVVLDYMKVAADKADAYIDVEKNVWKGIHEQRVKDGILHAWYLYRVENPPGQERDYAFVTVNVYDAFAKLENPYPVKYFTGVPAEELQKTGALRDLMRSEVWRLEDGLMASPAEDPFIVVDYMQPAAGSEAEYYTLETEVWKKFHEARIKEGLMNAWLFSGRMFPGGSETPYAAMTINVYASREAAADPAAGQVLGAVFEGMNAQQRDLVNRTDALRTIVKEDVWKRIDQVAPKPQP
jgi:hypothetical protein